MPVANSLRDAVSRSYLYRVLPRTAPDPFERGRALWWPHRVDFPALLYQLAVEGDVEPVLDYRAGVRLRWGLGNVDWLMLRSRETGLRRALGELFRSTGPRARGEILRRDDPAPAAVELSQYLGAAVRGALGRGV